MNRILNAGPTLVKPDRFEIRTATKGVRNHRKRDQEKGSGTLVQNRLTTRSASYFFLFELRVL
jgi:hypothetical protein